MKSICVFCGSSDKVDSIYLDAARDMGRVIADSGCQLVYGAGSTGLMGAVAEAVLTGGGEVIGVMPEIFNTPSLSKPEITRYEVVADMHTRKARMHALSDAFIALPGGFGTLDELLETITWAQIGLHAKPIGLLNTGGYYDGLIEFFHKIEEKGFTYEGHNGIYRHAADPAKLLESMNGYLPPEALSKWVDR